MKTISRYIILLLIVIILTISMIIIVYYIKEDNTEEITTEIISSTDTTIITNDNMFYVDLKGAVKNPGVYKVKVGTIVNELIEQAGGLLKNAYTDNINLSKRLTEESVIYIYTVSEYKKNSTTTTNLYTVTTTTSNIINKEITNEEDISNKKININTASINELTTLTGIGEAKALAIIAYRTKTPFNSIEDIMNISGIGESAFAKIKDYITVE